MGARPFLAAVFLAAACGNGGGAGDGGPDAGTAGRLPSPGLAPSAACVQLAAALGALEVRCGRMAAADEASWVAAYCQGSFAVQQSLWDAGLLAYDPAAVTCEASFRQHQPCNLAPIAPSGCNQLAWGVAVTGDACGDPASCENGDYCSRAATGLACGSCAADPTLGGNCGPAVSGAPCQGGGCDGFNCQEVVGLGEPCGVQSSVCQPLLSCNAAFLCEDPGGVQTSCGSDGDCQDGLYCDQNLLQCLFRIGDGGACPTGGCQAGFACAGAPSPQPDAGGSPVAYCQPLFPGGPCVGGLCLEAEACVDGGCVSERGLGQPCAPGSACLAGACVLGTCQELGAGQPCQSDAQCQTGLCGGSGATPVCAGPCASP
ncbi:MAG: hypothetical protein ACYDCL_04025 [Myxococcales bacterium]